MIPRALAALAALVLLAGCGGFGAGGEEGTATLWVTRDRGAEVLLDAEVEAGQSLMRALGSKVELETRYGGRYVQSINGLAGSLDEQRDWFWFVNGYEGDRSAAAYRLRDGDVAWLDYRGWEREGEARVVVGAFPEPFLHGYSGETRPAVVRFGGSRERAARLAEQIGAESVEPLGTPVPDGANVLELREGAERATAELLGETAGDPVKVDRQRRPRPDPPVRGADEPGARSRPARRRRHRRAAGGQLWFGRPPGARSTRDLFARPRGSPRHLSLRRSLEQPRRARTLAFPLVLTGRDRALGGADAAGLGPLDVTTTELAEAALNALRLAALGLAFAAYALLLDHDRLVAAAGAARRSALAVALATRLVPSLERDAAGLAEAVRGRGVRLEGARGYATLLSPLVAGSLERATGLAEAMEARGFGRSGSTRAPRPPWSTRDRLALPAAALLVTVAALWL